MRGVGEEANKNKRARATDNVGRRQLHDGAVTPAAASREAEHGREWEGAGGNREPGQSRGRQ